MDVACQGPLTIGDRVQHFVVQSVLGEGGTAVVYEAIHTRLNAAVALKVIDMRSPFAACAVERLQREAELCAAVQDPRVPKVFDVGRLPDGTPFLVMEKVSGTTLESVLARGRMGIALAMAVLRELLLAVEAVQRAGVVHRDIKPANLIVQFDGERRPSVRLMDFGISRSLWDRPGGSVVAATARGMILGTPQYMAPEQINGQPVGPQTDVYALGVVAYEMLAGRAPFPGEHPADIVSAVLRREHPPLRSLRPELPNELEELVERAMAAAPCERFANAQLMRAALERLPCPPLQRFSPRRAPAAARTAPDALGAHTESQARLLNERDSLLELPVRRSHRFGVVLLCVLVGVGSKLLWTGHAGSPDEGPREQALARVASAAPAQVEAPPQPTRPTRGAAPAPSPAKRTRPVLAPAATAAAAHFASAPEGTPGSPPAEAQLPPPSSGAAQPDSAELPTPGLPPNPFDDAPEPDPDPLQEQGAHDDPLAGLNLESPAANAP